MEPVPPVVEKVKANRNGLFPRKGKAERLYSQLADVPKLGASTYGLCPRAPRNKDRSPSCLLRRQLLLTQQGFPRREELLLLGGTDVRVMQVQGSKDVDHR